MECKELFTTGRAPLNSDIKDFNKWGLEGDEYSPSNNPFSELETIIFSGTKLDLTYLVNEIFDEESIDELSEFFHELKSDSLDLVLKEFSEDYETDDLALFRLYFYSKHAS